MSAWRDLTLVATWWCGSLCAQTTPTQLKPILEQRIQTPEATFVELRDYLAARIPRLPHPASAAAWTEEARSLRRRLLNDVVFRGWPREWVEAPLRVEERGTVQSGKGYRIRKLRYEIVPGFWSSAALYEPERVAGKAPAVLNLYGHVGPAGKAVEYEQKRCINQALQGMYSLSLEWFAYGELSQPGNEHWFGADLELVGVNPVGLFYLAMRKGLDYLYTHPAVDHTRLGVTGLSGGGWQTIVLSALDERVAATVPVAGFSSFRSRVERMTDIGDIEQNATDMFAEVDYAHLAAMLAPRPALLIYNAEDNCCFRAALTKPDTFDAVQPFFQLYGAGGNFGWHENLDPADHNYQLDNRVQSYRFFTRQFGLQPVESEVAVDGDIKTVEELAAGLPKDNLTILELARQLAVRINPSGMPDSKAVRTSIRSDLHYRPVELHSVWRAGSTKHKGLESVTYRFAFGNGLSATGVWLKAIYAPERAPATIVLNDRGRAAAEGQVSERLNRGEQVLALDLLLTGDMAPPHVPGIRGITQFLAALGDRPLAMEVAQLNTVARWMHTAAPTVRIDVAGPRSHIVGLLASALEPGLFAGRTVRDGLPSWRYLLDAPAEYRRTVPDLFCFGCYQSLELGRLGSLADAPADR
jgi:dienelactone hydrolase